jgi:hypothetical protein
MARMVRYTLLTPSSLRCVGTPSPRARHSPRTVEWDNCFFEYKRPTLPTSLFERSLSRVFRGEGHVDKLVPGSQSQPMARLGGADDSIGWVVVVGDYVLVS